MAGQTKTETRKQVTVEKTEVTLYECSNCEQEYERDGVEKIARGLSAEKAGDAAAEYYDSAHYLCEHCDENIFGCSDGRNSGGVIRRDWSQFQAYLFMFFLLCLAGFLLGFFSGFAHTAL